jgi:hypothetical protein
MKLIYYVGNKLGVKKDHYEFECMYAWTVIGLSFFACFAFFLPALGVLTIAHFLFEAKDLNTWPIYLFCTLFYIVLFEDTLHILEKFFKSFHKFLDIVGMVISKTLNALGKCLDKCVYSLLNRFCKRIEK